MTKRLAARDVEGQESTGVGPIKSEGGVTPADLEERTIGAAPFFSPRQQSGIGQQSGDEAADSRLVSEQQGWRRGIPSPESNPTETRRTTTRFPTLSMVHLLAYRSTSSASAVQSSPRSEPVAFRTAAKSESRSSAVEAAARGMSDCSAS